MDTNESPAPDPAARPISVYLINRLLGPTTGPISVANNMNRVTTVLDALSCLAAVDGEYSDGYEYGMTLIHQWLACSLKFATEHPDVEHVLPVVKDAQGGAS